TLVTEEPEQREGRDDHGEQGQHREVRQSRRGVDALIVQELAHGAAGTQHPLLSRAELFAVRHACLASRPSAVRLPFSRSIRTRQSGLISCAQVCECPPKRFVPRICGLLRDISVSARDSAPENRAITPRDRSHEFPQDFPKMAYPCPPFGGQTGSVISVAVVVRNACENAPSARPGLGTQVRAKYSNVVIPSSPPLGTGRLEGITVVCGERPVSLLAFSAGIGQTYPRAWHPGEHPG